LTATPTGAGTAVTDTSCTASPCTIPGLVNGTEYQVTVAAINSAGTGPESAATGPLTPATAAYAVDALSAVPGDTVVDLRWTPLTTAQLGGGTFSYYEISYREAGVSPTPSWTLATDALISRATDAYRVSGLDNGTSYDFQIVAYTSANASEIPGNTATVVQYPATVPSAPRSPSVLAATPTDVAFSWETPLTDGGEALTGYAVTVTSDSPGAASPVSCPVSGTTPRCTASNLTNGAVYAFAVEARNRMSTGSNGNVVTETYGVPSADSTLAALVVMSGGSALTLTPNFDPSTVAYAIDVAHEVGTVTVTPTATKAASIVTVNNVTVAFGETSGAVSLEVGENVIAVNVTASDPRYTTTYEVTVTRAEAPPEPAPDTEPETDSEAVDDTPPVGTDDEVFVGFDDDAAADAGDAVYIDTDGTITVATRRVVNTDGSTPMLVVGDDLAMTVTGRSAQDVRYDPATDRLVIRAGGTVLAAGDGYEPGTDAEVWLLSDPYLLGTVTVDDEGRWELQTQVPASTPAGSHHLQVEGTVTGGSERIIRAAVQVEAMPAALTLPVSGAEHQRAIQIAILAAALGAFVALASSGAARRRSH
jgi:hypothetical protein